MVFRCANPKDRILLDDFEKLRDLVEIKSKKVDLLNEIYRKYKKLVGTKVNCTCEELKSMLKAAVPALELK
ncbi:hypothetical protein A3Q56_06405 [Intoshia linei]|uniref:Uncharacterized protein n=1 Tax=Intoshia linei TaxID=1819745 RepID=A0A177AWU1_9BILA|nr:hypothetical protein A3Q56_06405 [Intoshia linei]